MPIQSERRMNWLMAGVESFPARVRKSIVWSHSECVGLVDLAKVCRASTRLLMSSRVRAFGQSCLWRSFTLEVVGEFTRFVGRIRTDL